MFPEPDVQLPVCVAHPIAETRPSFEASHERCYESLVIERCAQCGRPVSVYGVLWETAQQEVADRKARIERERMERDDDGA